MVYIIGDLHLSFGVKNKKMDIFGGAWENHEDKIVKSWKSKVKSTDTVILAGDFSWAINLNEVLEDFKFIDSLPGTKILIKGNHDYWWQTVKKMEDFLVENGITTVKFLFNNSIIVEDYILYGAKGWTLINPKEDYTNIRREVIRLKNSIIDGKNKLNKIKDKIEQDNSNENSIKEYKEIAILHYPPIYKYTGIDEYIEYLKLEENKTDEEINNILLELDFVNVLKENNIKTCYYAHLHGKSHKDAIIGNVDGINYYLVSGDYLDFKLQELEK